MLTWKLPGVTWHRHIGVWCGFVLWGSHTAATCLQSCRGERVRQSPPVWADSGGLQRRRDERPSRQSQSLRCTNVSSPPSFSREDDEAGKAGDEALSWKMGFLRTKTLEGYDSSVQILLCWHNLLLEEELGYKMTSWETVIEEFHILRVIVLCSCSEGGNWLMQPSLSPLMWEVAPLIASLFAVVCRGWQVTSSNETALWMYLIVVRKLKFTLLS